MSICLIYLQRYCAISIYTNSSCSLHPLHSILTLFYYWFPRWIQSGQLLGPCTNAFLSDSICIPRHATSKPACTIDCRYILRSPCLYWPHTRSPSFGTLQGCPCNFREGYSAGDHHLSPGRRDSCKADALWPYPTHNQGFKYSVKSRIKQVG